MGHTKGLQGRFWRVIVGSETKEGNLRVCIGSDPFGNIDYLNTRVRGSGSLLATLQWILNLKLKEQINFLDIKDQSVTRSFIN